MATPYDAYRTLRALTAKAVRPAPLYPRPSRSGALTEAQRETLPYVQRLKEERGRRLGLLQPVEALFDVLNRGQYVTANIAQQITDNVNEGRPWYFGVPQAVAEGLTGEQKGDWEKVLFGGELSGREIEGWIPWRPETWGGKLARGAIGFAANVALDPTTYVGLGPATAARGAATRYADDVTKLALRQLGQEATEALPKMIQKGYDAGRFSRLLAQNAKEGFTYLQKYAGEDMVRHLSRVWKRAYQRGLRTPGGQLTEEVTGRVKGMIGRAGERAGKEVSTEVLPRRVADLSLKQIEGKTLPASEIDELNRWLRYLGQEQPYRGAGTRAMRFARKEFAVGERYPTWLQVMDTMRGRFRESRIGGAFSDAWWAVMNNPHSPVAHIRRMLHVRNPYQKMLSIMEKDVMAEASHSMVMKGERILEVIDPLSPEQVEQVSGAMIWSQVLQEQHKAGNIPLTMSAEDIVRRFSGEQDVEAVTAAVRKIRAMTDEWEKFNAWAVNQGVARDMGHWQDYLPVQPTTRQTWRRSGTQLGTSRPGWQRAREVGWSGHIRQSVEKLKWMFGMDPEAAYRALKEGVGDLNVDLKDMLMRRAFAQTRFEQHVNMVLKFREMGVNVSAIAVENPELHQALVGKWGSLQPLGMKPVRATGLENYLFDSEVADIFERTLVSTSNDKAIRALTNAVTSFTSWWRGWATLSPGFHFRNFFSNNVTGFLKHGVEWMDPQTHFDGFIGAVVGLHGTDEGIKRLVKIGFPESMVRERLARRIAGQATLGEAAEYAASRGLITRMSRGFNQPRDYEEVLRMEGRLFRDTSLNPLSLNFAGMKASRDVGGVVESQAKFTSFLLDYRRAIQQGGAPGTAAEWAAQQAKKWWIDYCFDEQTEILTDLGWRRWDEVQHGERALTFSLDRQCLEWQPIKSVYVSDYSGPMHCVLTKSFDAVVTPRHKWIKENAGPRGGHWSLRRKGTLGLRETQEIADSHAVLRVSCSRYKRQDIPIYSDAFVELVGWFLTEGTFRKPTKRRDRRNGTAIQKHNDAYFYQSETHNPQYVEQIRRVVVALADEGYRVSELEKSTKSGVRVFYVTAALGKVLRHLFPQKALTMDFVFSLTPAQCGLLMRTILKGDGTRKVYRSGGEHWELAQKDGAFCDAFQALCFLCGHRTVTRWSESSGCYQVSVLRKDSKFYLRNAARWTVQYEGKVWCVETPNHTLVARRNGRVYLSGNSDLSQFEQKILKNIIPFYTWVRGNLANQIVGMMQFKEMYAMVPKAYEAVSAEGLDRRELPEWMRELGMIPIAETERGLYEMFWPNFPYQDLNVLPVKFRMFNGLPIPVAQDPSATIADIAQDAHPVIKTLIEVIPKEGIDLFYREPLGEVRRAPRMMRALTKSPRVLALLDGLLRQLGFENGLRADVNEKGQLVIDAKMAQVLEDNILLLNRIPQFLDFPELLVPAIERVKQRVTGAVDDYEGTEEALQTLSFYLGIKFKMADVEEEKFRRNVELLEEAQTERRRAQGYASKHIRRSLEWTRQQKKLQRKYGL